MLMRRALLNGGLPAEEFVELSPKGPNPTLTLVANSAEAAGTRGMPFAGGPILPRVRPGDPPTGIRHQCQCWVRANQSRRWRRSWHRGRSTRSSPFACLFMATSNRSISQSRATRSVSYSRPPSLDSRSSDHPDSIMKKLKSSPGKFRPLGETESGSLGTEPGEGSLVEDPTRYARLLECESIRPAGEHPRHLLLVIGLVGDLVLQRHLEAGVAVRLGLPDAFVVVLDRPLLGL
jgi:hypothetical protein